MKYYVCSVCSCFDCLPDDKAFKCLHCGSEKARKLTFEEYRGWPKKTG